MSQTEPMVVFWLVVAALLAALFGNAWRLDRRAARQGKVLVPVKTDFGRRTQFVAVDRATREEAVAAAALAAHERKRQELKLGPSNGGYVKAGDFFGGLIGAGLKDRVRRRGGLGGR